MSELIKIEIDGNEVEVPKGLTVVDAAMIHGVRIPVFCYHPKMEPVGMCRMCLVRIGMPMADRATREPIMNDDGTQKYNWGRGMMTGCTVYVAPGMKIQTDTEEVTDARADIIEFLLTSHPLDCPICDKGGECPLQNLTMAHGKGESRFYLADKNHNEKHVPLGDLITLDRERCIQCGRCTRFQDELVDDPVIGFHERGRRLEIVTLSEPGFDSIWSGNTTDICPVGALTSSDFRFGARAWELTASASLSPHGPVGENITMSTRREARSGGRSVIKRIMPRQNEWVNETWIPDQARFIHHFADSKERLTTPLIRKGGQLVEASWDDALKLVASKLDGKSACLISDRLSNEDLFQAKKLFEKTLLSDRIALANDAIAGGDMTALVGLHSESNLRDVGKGTTIVVVASDLHAAAPTWWLRVKQASERGATLIVANVRQTRLDKFADHSVRYEVGGAIEWAKSLASGSDALNDAVRDAENLVIYYGNEGISYEESDVLSKILGNLLIATEHAGKVNNGLVAVWPNCNTQGAWNLEIAGNEFKAAEVYDGKASTLYAIGTDPIGDGLMKRSSVDFLVVQELFLTETASAADVVLPAQSWAERDGTFTNGERRVQRYFPAIDPIGDSRPDWKIIAQVTNLVHRSTVPFAASLIFKQLAVEYSAYHGMSYQSLAEVVDQFPPIGDDDLYYGGTGYKNTSGLGKVTAAEAESRQVQPVYYPEISVNKPSLAVLSIPATYPQGTLLSQSEVLQPRVSAPTVYVNESDAGRLGIRDGGDVRVLVNGIKQSAVAHVNGHAPAGVVLVEGFDADASVELG